MDEGDDPNKPLDRYGAVRRLIWRYVQSPSLRHLRDTRSIQEITTEIVELFERRRPSWRKWSGDRDELAEIASNVWVPVEDLRAYLNDMPGPELTAMDVEERLNTLRDGDRPEEARETCERIYAEEKAKGTELPAVLRFLAGYVISHDLGTYDRVRRAEREAREAAHKAKQDRFHSGVDCGWTMFGELYAHPKPPDRFCRVNGRMYRHAKVEHGHFRLYRIATFEDRPGVPVGTYSDKKAIDAALETIAYAPDVIRPKRAK